LLATRIGLRPPAGLGRPRSPAGAVQVDDGERRIQVAGGDVQAPHPAIRSTNDDASWSGERFQHPGGGRPITLDQPLQGDAVEDGYDHPGEHRVGAAERVENLGGTAR